MTACFMVKLSNEVRACAASGQILHNAGAGGLVFSCCVGVNVTRGGRRGIKNGATRAPSSASSAGLLFGRDFLVGRGGGRRDSVGLHQRRLGLGDLHRQAFQMVQRLRQLEVVAAAVFQRLAVLFHRHHAQLVFQLVAVALGAFLRAVVAEVLVEVGLARAQGVQAVAVGILVDQQV